MNISNIISLEEKVIVVASVILHIKFAVIDGGNSLLPALVSAGIVSAILIALFRIDNEDIMNGSKFVAKKISWMVKTTINITKRIYSKIT